jgi:hypothetical protein
MKNEKGGSGRLSEEVSRGDAKNQEGDGLGTYYLFA